MFKLIDLSFSTTGVDLNRPSNKAYLTSVAKTSTVMDVVISLGNLNAGESFSTTGAWIEWKNPDYYLLSIQNTLGNWK